MVDAARASSMARRFSLSVQDSLHIRSDITRSRRGLAWHRASGSSIHSAADVASMAAAASDAARRARADASERRKRGPDDPSQPDIDLVTWDCDADGVRVFQIDVPARSSGGPKRRRRNPSRADGLRRAAARVSVAQPSASLPQGRKRHAHADDHDRIRAWHIRNTARIIAIHAQPLVPDISPTDTPPAPHTQHPAHSATPQHPSHAQHPLLRRAFARHLHPITHPHPSTHGPIRHSRRAQALQAATAVTHTHSHIHHHTHTNTTTRRPAPTPYRPSLTHLLHSHQTSPFRLHHHGRPPPRILQRPDRA